MRVLAMGGSGYVGTGVLPYLTPDFDITVFDMKPPKVDGVGYVEGSLFDLDAVKAAVASCEGLLYMAMAPEIDGVSPLFDKLLDGNVMTVYNTMRAAADCGIRHVVHTSSLSVHNESRGCFASEELPMDACSDYGLSKAMGEMVCKGFSTAHGISVIALRLYAPSPRDVWLAQCGGERPAGHTTFRDTARAYKSSLELTDHDGYDAVFISGDHSGTYVNCAKAKQMLGWEPVDRCE